MTIFHRYPYFKGSYISGVSLFYGYPYFKGSLLFTIVIHTFNFAQVQSMDDNCGEWVECMGVASGCGEQEVGVASGRG